MWIDRFACTFITALLASPALAAGKGCPPTPLDDYVRRGEDLYLGEGHGTVESPALMRCLVIAAMETGKKPLFVSLEQDASARDPEGAAWHGNDGRGSEAMWDLTRFLLEQEKAGRLELHLQLSFPLVFVPGETPPKLDFDAYERSIGLPLRELAARGQLIALGGNTHSRKERIPMPQFSYDPAGHYAGPGVVHVDLQSAKDGTAWNCGADGCGVHTRVGQTSFVSLVNALTDGKPFGHDLVYVMQEVTASPPKFPPATSPRGK